MNKKKTGEEPAGEARHKHLDNLVSMPMAATLAYIRLTGRNLKVNDAQLETMAEELARRITLYSISDDRASIVTLGPDDTQGGRFTKAGKMVEFPDGRKPITGVAVTRTSLNAAIDALRTARSAKG